MKTPVFKNFQKILGFLVFVRFFNKKAPDFRTSSPIRLNLLIFHLELEHLELELKLKLDVQYLQTNARSIVEKIRCCIKYKFIKQVSSSTSNQIFIRNAMKLF